MKHKSLKNKTLDRILEASIGYVGLFLFSLWFGTCVIQSEQKWWENVISASLMASVFWVIIWWIHWKKPKNDK